MATTVLVEVPTADGPVKASIDDSLVWDCSADGIRRMLQALVPPEELVGPLPSQPSFLGEVIEYAQSIVPFTILAVVQEEPKWDPNVVY